MNLSPAMIVRSERPLNAGPQLVELCRSSPTPSNLFFIRSHGTIPEIDPASYRLAIDGLTARSLVLSLTDLQRNFSRVTLGATLQCAGNRRQELIDLRPIPGELAWGPEAISHAVWSGAPLREVLATAGMDRVADRLLHVAFAGYDEVNRQNRRFNFGGSVPIEKALSSEVLLAYEMNGEPLAPAHGFPLRLVVPGYIGARSVKWLRHIRVQAAPSDNYFQARAYRLFPPQARADNVDWASGLMLGETSINSAICSPQAKAIVSTDRFVVQGYAAAGGARRIERVELSCDGGVTWQAARLLGDDQDWTWRLWSAEVQLPPGQHELVVRAFDSAANTQPADAQSIWNFKGYMNNAWHRLKIEVR